MKTIAPGVDTDASRSLTHYHLRVRPLQLTADPEFLWVGENHREVLAALRAGVFENAGLLLLTGDVGTGKTTLTNALVESLGDGVSVARLGYPSLEPLDFFKVIAQAYDLGGGLDGREAFLRLLVPFLHDARAKDRQVLLVIDEAQSLGGELFEEIRHLSLLERETVPLMSILLVGEDALGVILGQPQHQGLGPRIGVTRSVAPLTEAETGEYIAHRLKVAGSDGNPFSPAAVREIWVLAGGVPRLINTIGDLALLSGCRSKVKTITAEMITECAGTLALRNPSGEPGKRRRYALPATSARRVARTRRRGRVAAVSAGLVLLVIFGGYLYAKGRPERPSTPASAEKSFTGEQSSSVTTDAAPVLPPAPAREAETEARRDAPDASAAIPVPKPPVDTGGAVGRGKPNGDASLTQIGPSRTPAKPGTAPAARESASAERAAPDSTGKGPRPARVEPPARGDAPNDGGDAPDPSAIIDWLLQGSQGRR